MIHVRNLAHPLTGLTGARFSECGRYRTLLWRFFKENPQRLVLFLMLNGSTATGESNDPTVERCCRRTLQWGFDGVLVANLFGWMSTDPVVLKAIADPVGQDNDTAIDEAAEMASLIICAWGKHGDLRNRGTFVMQRLKRFHAEKLAYLRMTKSGHPEHPLYVPYDEIPKRFIDGKPIEVALPAQQAALFPMAAGTVEAL